MRSLWLIIMAGVGLAGAMPTAERVFNLSGTWVLDPAHSESTYTPPGIRKINISSSRGISRSVEDPNDRDGKGGNDFPEERIDNLILLIVQTDGELQATRQFTIDGEERTVHQKFALDGSQCINLAANGRGEFVSRTNWKNDRLINSGTETITIREQKTEISLQEEYSISKNGKKLTIKTTRITPRGVTVLKQVFNKPGKSKS